MGTKTGAKTPLVQMERPLDNKTKYANNPKITLGYWKCRGLAQPIRYLLEYTEHPWEDVLYEQGDPPNYSIESWLQVKNTLGLDFPNVPYLIDGDVKITEQNAMMLYICHSYAPELLGESPEQKAEIDMLSGILKEVRMGVTGPCYQVGTDRQQLKKVAKSKIAQIVNHT